MPASQQPSHPPPGLLVRATVVLGVGLGGLFDGIVFHQLLQWHHVLSSAVPPDTVPNLRLNTLADGAFHASTWLITLAGLWLLVRSVGRGSDVPRGRVMAGGLLAGWGAFNVVEGIVDHYVLRIHHVRPGPDEALYDLAFVIWGAAFVGVGWWLARSARAGHDPWGRDRRLTLGDTGRMKLYFAGPLFTSAELTWNARVAEGLRAAGHEVFLPQEQESGMDGPRIFATDVGGLDWADGLVGIMDGADPDAGTSWEVGYAYAKGKPIVLVRTDIRAEAGPSGDYSPMLTQAATTRVDLPAASIDEVIAAIVDALARISA